jgi:hypothetical protein
VPVTTGILPVLQLNATKKQFVVTRNVPFTDSHDHGNLTFVGTFLDGEAVAQA